MAHGRNVRCLLWVPPKTKGIVAEKDVLSKVSYVMRSQVLAEFRRLVNETGVELLPGDEPLRLSR